MEPVIVFVALFATVFGVMYVFFTTRNKERLAMIEKGADASLFERKGMKFSIAKFILNLALLLMGIGLGIFTGYIMAEVFDFHDDVAITSMLFFFGGLGLIAGFFITRKLEKEVKE